jgi:NAD+ kinase
MQAVRKVGIISKPGVDRAHRVVPELLRWLAGRGIEARCDEETAAYDPATAGVPRVEVAKGTDMVILLGGDGTLLSAVRAIGDQDVPLFAVNLGGLGFLTAITVEELYPELERALAGEHLIGRRRLLECNLMRDGEARSSYRALNDVVVDKTDLARMIDLEVDVDDQVVCDYKADGLISSTPTGSTAYSLSAGGPIIFPTVEALMITPICPHMLTNRPVVVPMDRVIKLTVRTKNDASFLTIDGQVGEPLKQHDTIICRSSDTSIRLVRPPLLKFFDVLRQKLKWGER